MDSLTAGLFFDFYSVGALILVAFHFTLAMYFLTMPNRSRSTFHLGMAFSVMVFFNLAYVACYSLYFDSLVFHRWITVPFILLGLTHINVFIVYFPDGRNPVAARRLLIIQYIVTIAASAYFMIKTFAAPRIYNINCHYWDFDADRLSGLIGLIILLAAALFVALLVWRVIQLRGRERWWLLFLGVAYLAGSLAPSILNTLSRDGLVSRDIYQITLDLCHIFGFFIVAIGYISSTTDRTTFMVKIVGVSLVAFLVILQGMSYSISLDQEGAYDEIHRTRSSMALTSNYRPGELSYIYSWSDRTGKMQVDYEPSPTDIETGALADEFSNTYLYEKIKSIGGDTSGEKIKAILAGAHKYFAGYAGYLMSRSSSWENTKENQGELAAETLNSVWRKVQYHKNKISQLPDATFRESFTAYLGKMKKEFAPFITVFEIVLSVEKTDGAALKSEILRYLAPARPAGVRGYRISRDGHKHYVSFFNMDESGAGIHETGFTYIGYRSYIHPGSMKQVLILGLILVFVTIGFPLFFLGTLIRPLKSLLNGVRTVKGGDLTFNVPVKSEDEIGFLTRSFNDMVNTIRTDKQKLDEYAQSLEQKVRERTRELEQSMSELAEARDALWGEMQLAKKIQTVLLPKSPGIPGYSISAYILPADEVGGDYYDVVNVEGKDWIVIGDVSGHGVPAGLVMMMVQTSIHVVLSQNPGVPPSELLTVINKTVSQNIHQLGESKYMTITVLAAHENGQFTFSGLHLDMMVYRAADRSVEYVETHGIWIGIMENINGLVHDNVFSLNTGDMLLLYTDGLTEAVDDSGAMFSEKRLKKCLEAKGGGEPEGVKDAILEELKKFSINDDVTIVALKRL